MKKPVIVICGPTASGKTGASISLAKKINGEIVSCDSMQIYKYMDIGTAKPTENEKHGIKHYLIDEIYPNEDFSVAKYKELALKYIGEIGKHGKVPIVVGGTGLYINSLVYNIKFTESETNWELRNQLQEEANKFGNEFLHKKLEKIDPIASSSIHPNNVKRVIRAIEIFETTGKTITIQNDESRCEDSEYEFLIFCLDMDRDKLYDRIDKRVDMMFKDGLQREVANLLEMGYNLEDKSMQGLGYKEIIWYYDQKITLEEANYIIKRDSRHYAKRQLTWFRKLKGVNWINANDSDSILKNIMNHIETSGIIL